jgi:hypothetical protein
MMNEISLMWIDPGVTTGIAIYSRWADGRQKVQWEQVEGLAQTCKMIESSLCYSMINRGQRLGYESFYIGERTIKAEIANVRAATDIIGWVKGQYSLGQLCTWLPLVDQTPAERTPKIITPNVVEACLGDAPVGQRHAMDAARHIVRFLVSTDRDPTIRKRYADAVGL